MMFTERTHSLALELVCWSDPLRLMEHNAPSPPSMMSRNRNTVATLLAHCILIAIFAQFGGVVGCNRSGNSAANSAQTQAQKQPWQDRIVNAELTPEAFSELVAEVLAETSECKNAKVVGPMKLSATLSNGEADLNLESVWSDCRNQTDLRVDVVERYLAGVAQTFTRLASNAPPDVEQIVPLIKSKRWLEHAKQQGIDVYQQLLVSDLIVVYAEDGTEQLRYVSRAECEAIGVSDEDMRAITVRNLKSRLPDVKRHGKGPLYMLTAGGTFESSLILFSSFWDSVEDVVDGRIVVATPSRDLLMFTGENASEAVQEMRELAEETYQDGSYAISKALLVREDGRWVPWSDGKRVPRLQAEPTHKER